MGLLDDIHPDWTAPELRELRDLLVLAFDGSDEARNIANEAGIFPGTFPTGSLNARATWTDLISVITKQGKLRDLVRRAAANPVAGGYAARLAEMLEDEPVLAAPQPSTRWNDDSDSEPLALQRLLKGRSRLIDLTLAAGVMDAAQSVARLTLRLGDSRLHGTGFLLGPDLLLTNHHNFENEECGQIKHAVAEFDHDSFTRDHRLARELDLASIIGDPVADWAVIRLGEAVTRPPLKLGSPYGVNIDDLLVIIQHPAGGPKKFALQPRAVRYLDEDVVEYVADTQHGSSGSPVFNESMHVVALHRAERQRDMKIAGKLQTLWHNQGVRIETVMRGLRERRIPFEER